MKILTPFITLLVFITMNLQAQESRPATIEDLMAVKTVMDPQISPDGSTVLYVVSAPNVEDNKHNTDVWLVSADDTSVDNMPIQLTNGPDMDQTPRWSPDGRSVAFLSARGGPPQLFLINPRGGEARQLTEVESGIQSYSWSPSGDRIAYLSQDALTEEQKTAKEDRDGVIVVDAEFQMNHLHTIDVETSDTVDITSGDYTVTDFNWSPDGGQFALTRQPTPRVPDGYNSDIYLVSSDGGELTPLVVRPGSDGQPVWSPNGKRIVFVSAQGSQDPVGSPTLALIRVSGGKPRPLGPSLEESPGSITWSKDGRTVYLSSLEGVSYRLFAVSVRDDSVTALTLAGETQMGFTLSDDGNRAAIIKTDPATPPEVFISEFPSVTPRQLTQTNPQLDQLILGSMEPVRWQSTDGMEIEGILLKPTGYEEGKRYPLLTYVHGGPSGVFTLAFLPQMGGFPIALQAAPYPLQAFAGAGFAVFMPNPRGSSGYGREFQRANIKDWGHGDFLDIQSGIDHLVAQGIADANHLGLMGWSYGGYMTSWAITQTDRFKAASVGAGLPDMFSMYGNTDIPGMLEGYFGDFPWNDPEMYDRSSAMRFAGNIVTPTLIQHGEKDDRVQLSQAWELYRALQGNEVPASFAIYPGQGHLIMAPKQQKDMLLRNYEWFSRWVLPEH